MSIGSISAAVSAATTQQLPNAPTQAPATGAASASTASAAAQTATPPRSGAAHHHHHGGTAPATLATTLAPAPASSKAALNSVV